MKWLLLLVAFPLAFLLTWAMQGKDFIDWIKRFPRE